MCRSVPHHMTLLDGEMVVDEDLVADRQERRYLAYDLVLLQGSSVMHKPFKVCFPCPSFAGKQFSPVPACRSAQCR